MHDFEILRQCCGLQMSKYEVLRLNGCDVSQYIYQPDYPHCESHDLTTIEASFANSPIPFHVNSPEYNWEKPGDCARFNAEVSLGKGFNGRSFDSCEITGKFVGRKGDKQLEPGDFSEAKRVNERERLSKCKLLALKKGDKKAKKTKKEAKKSKKTSAPTEDDGT